MCLQERFCPLSEWGGDGEKDKTGVRGPRSTYQVEGEGDLNILSLK